MQPTEPAADAAATVILTARGEMVLSPPLLCMYVRLRHLGLELGPQIMLDIKPISTFRDNFTAQ